MTDTIEWLETIGKKASLRHAPAKDLAHTLAQTNASNALKEAVKDGNRSRLASEFGDMSFWIEHNINITAHEEELT